METNDFSFTHLTYTALYSYNCAKQASKINQFLPYSRCKSSMLIGRTKNILVTYTRVHRHVQLLISVQNIGSHNNGIIWPYTMYM